MRLYIIIIILCAFLVSCKDKKYNYKSKGEWVHLKNGETIDGYTRIGDSIYGGYGDSIYLHTTMPALKGVDVSSFMVCKKNRVCERFVPCLLSAKACLWGCYGLWWMLF